MWEQEENWLFHKCPELLWITRSNQPWGWTFLLTSQKPDRKDEEDRHFFSLIMRKNDTQEAFQSFLQYGLSFKSSEREMNTENSSCATKKSHTPEQNPQLKGHYKGRFNCKSWLSGHYASKALKITTQTIFQNEYLSGATLGIVNKMEARPQPPLLILQARSWDEGVRSCDSDLFFPFFSWIGCKEC